MSSVIEDKVAGTLERAKGMLVTTPEQFVAAGEFLKVIKGLQNEVSETHDPVIKHWHGKHKDALAEKARDMAPLEEAERIMKPRIADYIKAEEEKRKEAERLVQQQLEADAVEQQVADAVLLDEIGETDRANALLEEQPYVPPVILPRMTPKVAGISSTKRYSAQVVNLMELLKAVVAGQVPIQAVQANTVFLNQQARSMKEALKYPGVKLIAEGNISASGR